MQFIPFVDEINPLIAQIILKVFILIKEKLTQ
jgi:hypothetical protein